MKSKIRGVFERPAGSGIWWINYYDQEGKRHREKIGKQKVAENAYVFRRNEVRQGKFDPPRMKTRLTFRELTEQALADKKLRLARRSWKKDEQRLKPLQEAFADLAAEKLTTGMIESFLAGLRNRNCSGATANRYRALVSSVYSFGVRAGLLRSNPVRQVRQFRESEHRIRFLDAKEEQALRVAIREQSLEHEAEFDLALHTGIRRGEQFGLKWENIDLEHGFLTVNGKTGRRHVRMNETAKAAIKILWPASNGSRFVCPETKHEGQDDWRRWFQEACQKAGVDNFHWHDLRHTFASRLVMAGVDLYTVKNLLGHKSILTTQRYAHLAAGHEQDAVNRLVMGTQLAPEPESQNEKLLKFR